MNGIRIRSGVVRGLLTLLTVAILAVFTFEFVGIVAFRYLYPPAPSLGYSVVLTLHCALAAVLSGWLYYRVFHRHLWIR